MNAKSDYVVIWSKYNENFQPRFQTCYNPSPGVVIHPDVSRGCSDIDIFLTLFPKRLFMHIAESTNKRLKIYDINKGKSTKPTDMGEIMMLIGCNLIMQYNKLPDLPCYWSNHKSLGNKAIQDAISRDRFVLLYSKLYLADPEKPDDASKTYYIDEILSCLKITFQEMRSESEVQSIDESMPKFKGRSSLKQYMPQKPTKRGIKMWQRCDSLTGYVYDLNIYAGKESEQVDGTLGERVVHKLAETIRANTKVTLFFDRFFTSVKLIDTLNYAAVGTCIKTRKNIPNLQTKLKKGESEFRINKNGTLFVQWRDSKDVMVLSNCHSDKIETAVRKQKDGSKLDVPCPESIVHYNKYMNGVDRCDQMATIYGHGRKSRKWWKKVFEKLVMISVVNAWIVKCEISNKKVPMLSFIVPLAEELISTGRETAKYKRNRKYGRPSKRSRSMLNVGDHLPIQQKHRKRCCRCSASKIEKRTYTICQTCQVALCMNCFTPYHT